MRIDVHNHFYPGAFLNDLEKMGGAAGLLIETDPWGRKMMVHNGNRVVTLTPPMTDVNARLEDMRAAGVDTQVLTLSIPSVDIFPPDIAVQLARSANDAMAEVCASHPQNFMSFATLPFVSPQAAIEELERCIQSLGFKGACMGSNINGMGIDHESLYPFYERMAQYDLPIHIHPRTPPDKNTFKDYAMGPMLGFEVDLCVAVVRLVMGGVMDRFPGLNFVVSHLGGAIPYLAERIQNCFEAYPECQKNVSGTSAKEYLKLFYYDTVSFFEPALMCAYKFVGPDHMILGSDYPHVIGDIREAVSTIEALDIPDEEKERIFSGNLRKLMHVV
jgi:aminocarboxymuconate-semialdehyde decarboxylase